ncbi:hypothetical protein Tco_0439947 [Tanacetum coccineum]
MVHRWDHRASREPEMFPHDVAQDAPETNIACIAHKFELVHSSLGQSGLEPRGQRACGGSKVPYGKVDVVGYFVREVPCPLLPRFQLPPQEVGHLSLRGVFLDVISGNCLPLVVGQFTIMSGATAVTQQCSIRFYGSGSWNWRYSAYRRSRVLTISFISANMGILRRVESARTFTFSNMAFASGVTNFGTLAL